MNLPETVDIAVIGGGISGLGVALEASLNGFSVALFERESLASATSHNSLRIIHGGIRYLQQLNFSRVLESIRAQAELLEDFPHIIKALPCIMPLASGGMKSRVPMACASALYRALAQHAGVKAVKTNTVNAEFVKMNIPQAAALAPRGAFLWHDAVLTNPSALIEAISQKATACGAVILEKTRVSAVGRSKNLFVVSLASEGNAQKIKSKVVVDATGPWLDAFINKSDRQNEPLAQAWCKAFNIVLSKQIDPHYAVGLHSPQKRLLFAVPRGSQTALGTCYIAHLGPPEKAQVLPQEIDAFLSDFRAAWPQAGIANSDVSAVECGVLPMQHVGPFGPVLFGQEKIVDRGGYISVMSTKYTTFRTQARKVIELARRRLS